MIRTRPLPGGGDFELDVVGDGPYVLALTFEQLELIACFTCMIGAANNPNMFTTAAGELLDMIETVSGDDDFSITALDDVRPIFKVYEPVTFNLIHTFDEDHTIEILV